MHKQKTIAKAFSAGSFYLLFTLYVFILLFNVGCKKSSQDHLQNIIQQAEAGQVDSQYQLCEEYTAGKSVERDVSEGLKWCEQAAAQNHIKTLNYLGDIYRKGEILSVDFAKSNDYYMKSAELDDAYGQFQIGYSYMEGTGIVKDVQKGLEWVEKSANQNNALAQSYLGKMYADGDGVPVDYKLALDWSSKAAEQGDSNAQHDLGLLYLSGKGVQQDKSKAQNWFQKSASQDNPYAHYNLGKIYYHGPGEIYFKAGEEFRLAVQGGIKEAESFLSLMESECAKHEKIAGVQHQIYCMVAAGAGTSSDSEFKIGEVYLTTNPPDKTKGLKWLRKAAGKNNPKAILLLAVGYFEGDWVEKNDPVESYAWAELLQQKKFEEKYRIAGEKLRSLLKEKMSPDQLSAAEKKSEEYKNLIKGF